MTFTDIVLQINGEITQRRQFSWTELQRNEGYRRVVQGLGMLLDEKISQSRQEKQSFRVPLDTANGFELDWNQPDSFSALATFIRHGKLSVICLLFSGIAPVHDAVAVTESEKFLACLCHEVGVTPKPGIIFIPDRPLLACVPCQHEVEPLDQQRLSLWTVSLAVAFFQRAMHSVDPSRN